MAGTAMRMSMTMLLVTTLTTLKRVETMMDLEISMMALSRAERS